MIINDTRIPHEQFEALRCPLMSGMMKKKCNVYLFKEKVVSFTMFIKFLSHSLFLWISVTHCF